MPGPLIVTSAESLTQGGAAVTNYYKACGGAVVSAESVAAHMRQLQEAPARIISQADPSEDIQMAAFRADLEKTVGKGAGAVSKTPGPLPEEERLLFTDQEESSLPSAAVSSKPGKGKGKKNATAPADQAQLPALLVTFDDDGRRQSVRAHAVALTHDQAGLMLLTPLAHESRYFPRPHSVFRITTKALGERWAYCPHAGAHVDFPGQGVSSYLLVSEEEAVAFGREQRLAAARAVLAEEEKLS